MALTEEDKIWISGALDRKFSSLEQKSELLENKFAFLEQKLEEKLAPLATREDVEKIETKLLTAFHRWSSPIENRIRTLSTFVKTLDSELEVLKDRVKALEDQKGAA